MRRWLSVLATGIGVLHVGGAVACAQTTGHWPPVPFERGPGLYLNWFKLVIGWLVFLIWVATCDWASTDCQRHRLAHQRWNGLLVFPFLALFVASWWIPIYWVSLPLLLLAHYVPLGLYVQARNAKVEMHERVMTSDHLRFLIAERLNSIGFSIEVERKLAHELGPPLQLLPAGGATERDDAAHLILAHQSPGFVAARELLSDALANRADAVMLEFSAQEVAVRYQVDGVWHNGEARDRESGDAILFVLKTLASLNAGERRLRQQGTVKATVEKTKYNCRFSSQGTKTGERAVLQFDDGVMRFKKIADLGLREKLQEQLQERLQASRGLVLVATLPAGGFTTTFDAVVNSTDRFIRSFIGLEEFGYKERFVENVPVETYDPAKAESPATIMTRVARMYPDALVSRNLPDGASVDALCAQASDKRMVIAGLRARDAVEAVLRVQSLGGDATLLANTLSGVLYSRMIRKLCETCREAYPPPPQILKQMGLPPGRIEAFYRPPTQPEKPCEKCNGIGYLGRTAIFELLVPNDEFRQALLQTPRGDALRLAARKTGMRTLQEEGLLLVAKGVTSVDELVRVLKEGSGG